MKSDKTQNNLPKSYFRRKVTVGGVPRVFGFLDCDENKGTDNLLNYSSLLLVTGQELIEPRDKVGHGSFRAPRKRFRRIFR